MKVLIIGGSGCGKSELAENMAIKLKKNIVYYVACMIPYGDEGKRRVERHRKLREGKGFVTIEQYRDADKVNVKDTVILECVSNLIANEMFGDMPKNGEYVAECIENIQADNIIVVTGNVAEDGIEYDNDTMRYMEELNLVNSRLAQWADRVIETVCGVAVRVK